jgi:hypothetical protein
VAAQRAILMSYESVKKAEAGARVGEEVDEEQLRHALDVSVQRAPTVEAGGHLFMEERQRLLKDTAEHRAFSRESRGSGDGSGEAEEGGIRRWGRAVECPEGWRVG